ncbi:hypothetical protein NDU88_003433 [Pleurodeles waltl]|uniref:Uncharacterized protein n=1 Tax=Pleurodeles waltl TaxID=8319 RepID=A0AAV7TP14_PLEWA|nr:hypothetical protein NDU88_003433 [Pleurodeles waltl]
MSGLNKRIHLSLIVSEDHSNIGDEWELPSGVSILCVLYLQRFECGRGRICQHASTAVALFGGVSIGLLSAIGLREFKNLPQIDNNTGEVYVYQLAKKQLQECYGRKINVVLERYKFYSRMQHDDETIDQFVAAFRGKLCKNNTRSISYVSEHDEMDENRIQDIVLRVLKDNDGAECNFSKLPTCKLLIDAIEVTAMVDLCAWFTIMCLHMFKKLWPGRELIPTDVNPGRYTGHRIPIMGYVNVHIEFQSRQYEGKLYVAEKGQLILGWPHIKKLGMNIDSAKFAPVYTVLEHHLQQALIYDELDKNFPAVFSESLGCVGLEPHEGLEQGILTEQEWDPEMVKDNEMQVVKGYILNGWPSERVLRGEGATLWKLKDELSVCGEFGGESVDGCSEECNGYLMEGVPDVVDGNVQDESGGCENDYTHVQKFTQSFDAVKQTLLATGLKYMLVYPAKLHVLHDEKSYFFTGTMEIWNWLKMRDVPTQPRMLSQITYLWMRKWTSQHIKGTSQAPGSAVTPSPKLVQEDGTLDIETKMLPEQDGVVDSSDFLFDEPTLGELSMVLEGADGLHGLAPKWS